MNLFKFVKPQPNLLSIILEGDRIRLVTISDQFERDIFQEFTEEITTYMFPSPAENIEETRKFIVESRNGIEAGYNLQFVILSKVTGEFLGNCGLHGENQAITPEIGIWLKKNAHGKGYGREAVHTLVKWSKNNIDLDYFIYPVDSRNTASRKIPESLGGQIIEQSQVKTPTGKILDYLVYKIPS
ncbi:MAG: GNAT family N-acetyltransferase [Xenococcaceae cyanobacterium]